MKRTIVFLGLTVLLFATGCSSLPSISMPWSSAPRPDPNADAVFNRGMELFNNKKYVAALDQFTRIKQEFPFAPQAIQAELKIGECYYLNQQYPEAITAFQEFQSLHPTNENIPFVIYSLGLAHFDQFTATDRDQKNTQAAKGYFETVVKNYPKSPYAAQAKEKLAKTNGYLAEHDFSIAFFYFQQEKYAAARGRFEEIVRRYRGTQTAAKSLFYLGESYKQEKNGVRAALAYEAILQHYPETKFAKEAKTQLAQLEKEKHDPLAMLLMRDGRPPSAASSQPNSETATAAKLKNVDNLVAKTEVVYEEPGQEKGIFRRVVDTINPFSSSSGGKKKEVDVKKSESEAALQVLAKKKAAEKKDESPGVLASLWNGINPFSGQKTEDKQNTDSSMKRQLVDQIDNSLKDKGIDSKGQTAFLQTPPAALPNIEEVLYPQANTGELLGKIDTNLKKEGKAIGELPSPPEAAHAFKDPAAAQMTAAKGPGKTEPPPSVATTGLLGSIDEKLKSKGIAPSQVELPTDSPEAKGNAPKKEPTKKVELEPKVAVEKGPLFLGPAELQLPEPAPTNQEPIKQDNTEGPDNSQEPGARQIPKSLVIGPVQPAPAQKPTEQKNPAAISEDEEKGVLDQLKQDADSIGKILNPFRW